MMDEKLSALMDNELDAEEASACIDVLADQLVLRQTWSRQNLVRAVLRDQVAGESEIADRVMAALSRAEAAGAGKVGSRIIPFRIPRLPRQQWAAGLAVAASVAAVAVFMPFLNSPNPVDVQASQMAQSGTVPEARQVAYERARANAEARRELQQYLLDHEALASGHGLSSQRAYMRMASPGTAYVTYTPER